VTVEQRAGDTGLPGDLLHQHIVIRMDGEQPRAHGEELGSAVGGTEALAGRHAARLLDTCLLASHPESRT
jgi:hypothetical protein